MLGSSVSHNVQTTLESHQTGDVDDLAEAPGVASGTAFGDGLTSDTTSRFEHMPTSISSDSEDSVQVDLENFVPVIIREVLNRVSTLDTATVHDNVKSSSELLGNVGNELANSGRITEVANDNVGLAAGGNNGVSGGGVASVTLDKDDVGTSFGESKGHSGPDASGCASNPKIVVSKEIVAEPCLRATHKAVFPVRPKRSST